MQSARPTGNPPMTPDPHARISKRAFDRLLSNWRRRLHEFDDKEDGEIHCPLSDPKDNTGKAAINGSLNSCLSPENLAYSCTPSTRADSEELSPPLNLNLHLAELLQPPGQAQALTTTPAAVSGSVVAPRWSSVAGVGSPMGMAALMPAQMIRATPAPSGLQAWQAPVTTTMRQPQQMMAVPPNYLWATATPCGWQTAVSSQQAHAPAQAQVPCAGVVVRVPGVRLVRAGGHCRRLRERHHAWPDSR
eukprot:CAMPEP_0175493560 /NCGR_PEP_ID=MMETSP0096-20121207/2833_1 /TAXON_ID=311494 /ORGANISM="Alexandrium monilatum, Strain CCMP3105" /LENGTH=246 /DNA_ID=CAMNT_0016795503 /DNA_START=67 /DNA_END=803 /DNA_ORIENTATION=-